MQYRSFKFVKFTAAEFQCPIVAFQPDSMYIRTYTLPMRVYWDSRNASTNLIKHGIHFADAVPALFDEGAITVPDDVEGEKRYVILGMDALARVMVIV